MYRALCGLSVAVCAVLFQSHAPVDKKPGTGPAALEEMVRGLVKALNAGDKEGLRACVASEDKPYPVLLFDMDAQARPVRAAGAKAALAHADGWLALIKEHGIQFAIKRLHVDCASPDLGYATLELDETIKQGAETIHSSYRATLLASATRPGGKWQVFHWHGSLGTDDPADEGARKK